VNDYPRMMYKDGYEVDVNGVHVDTLTVYDAVEESVAMLDGWRTTITATEASTRRRGRPPKVTVE